MYQFRKKGHLATALVAACILAQLCNGSPVPAPPAANQGAAPVAAPAPAAPSRAAISPLLMKEVESVRNGRSSVVLPSSNSHLNLVSSHIPRQNTIFDSSSAQLSPSIQAARLLSHVVGAHNKPVQRIQISRSSPGPKAITPVGRAFSSGSAVAVGNQNQGLLANTGGVTQQTQNALLQQGGGIAQNSFTVGDLVRSLDGRNGIKVISLNDMKGLTNGQPKSNNDGGIMQQLRNALISENLQVDLSREQRQLDGLFGGGVSNNGGSGGFGNGLADSSSQNSFILGDGTLGSDDLLTSGFVGGNSGSTVNDITNPSGGSLDTSFSNDVGAPLPDLTADLTASSGLDVGTDDYAPLNTDDFLAADYDDYSDIELDDEPSLSLPAQPPNVFRTGVSDILFTKGQWVGTLIGGLIDLGSAIGDGVSKLFTSAVGGGDDDNK